MACCSLLTVDSGSRVCGGAESYAWRVLLSTELRPWLWRGLLCSLAARPRLGVLDPDGPADFPQRRLVFWDLSRRESFPPRPCPLPPLRITGYPARSNNCSRLPIDCMEARGISRL